MTPSKRPTQATYRRRRTVAVLAIVFLLVTAGLLLRAALGEQPAKSKASGHSASRTTSSTPTPSKHRPTAVGGGCNPADILVAPSVDAAHAIAGHPVPVTLSITNKSSSPCTWQVSATTTVLKINNPKVQGSISGVSGGASGDVWSTQNCSQALPTTKVDLAPSQPTSITLTWQPFPSPTNAQGNNCPGTTDWMYPGQYTALAAAIGGTPTSTAFQLTAPAPQTVIRTAPPPSPKTSPTASPTSKQRKRAHG